MAHQNKLIFGRQKSQKGSLLLEVLISVGIFSFGVVGIMHLVGTVGKRSSEEQLRQKAVSYTQELAGLMVADTSNISAYSSPSHLKRKSVEDKLKSSVPNSSFSVTLTPSGARTDFLIVTQWNQTSGTIHKYATLGTVAP